MIKKILQKERFVVGSFPALAVRDSDKVIP